MGKVNKINQKKIRSNIKKATKKFENRLILTISPKKVPGVNTYF